MKLNFRRLSSPFTARLEIELQLENPMQKFTFSIRTLPLATLFSLQVVAQSCPKCRPLVQKGIHDAAFSLNLAEVLLPIFVMLSIAVSLLCADAYLTRRAQRMFR